MPYKDPEKNRAYHKKYRETHREKISEYTRNRREKKSKYDQLKACREALKNLVDAEVCPNCIDKGWFIQANRNTGDAEQEQCQWCYEIETSLFRRKKQARAVLGFYIKAEEKENGGK